MAENYNRQERGYPEAGHGYESGGGYEAGQVMNRTFGESGAGNMDNWKRAAMIGSFSAAAFLLVTGRRAAGYVCAGVGLAVLASEHPQKFEEVFHRAPEYLEKGTRIVQQVSGILEKIGEQGNRWKQRNQAGADYLT